MDCELTLH